MRSSSAPARAVALAAALLVTLAACGNGTAEDGAPVATERCGAVEFPEMQFGSHLIGQAEPPVPYSSVPPSSGWHSSGAPPVGVQDSPISEPRQVAALEAGGVVVTHHGLPDDEVAALTSLVEAELADRVVVTEYQRLPQPGMVLASWGALQRCDGFDEAAVRAYTEAYGNPIETHG